MPREARIRSVPVMRLQRRGGDGPLRPAGPSVMLVVPASLSPEDQEAAIWRTIYGPDVFTGAPERHRRGYMGPVELQD